MRILASAYACEPGAGSELGKGWNLVCEMARQGHDVTVLTCGSHHRAAIERYRREHGLPVRLRFVWHDIPGWPGPGYANARRIRRHYYVWQMTARKLVAKLHAETPFDVIHHLTWTVLRWPSCLGGLGPRFIFGPVGGGQSTPWPLRRGFPLRGWKFELKRDVANLLSRFDPMVLRCLAQADAILVTDEATRRHVPAWWRGKTFVTGDVYAPSVTSEHRPPAEGNGPELAILFAGRLEYWKGAQLALGAVARLRRHVPRLAFTIAGSGPDEDYLRAVAARLGVDDIVRFAGNVPHDRMSRLYASHDVFLFPSLHDSAANVIGEALAHALPVVCLDLGGSGTAVDDSCGRAVAAEGRSPSAVERDLARAVLHICADADRLAAFREGARLRAAQCSYERRAAERIARFYPAR
jgi:glycosyltransferase involved in cell wall biosynthesis